MTNTERTTIDWDAVKERAHRELSGAAYDVIADLLEFAGPDTKVMALLANLCDYEWTEFHGFDDYKWKDALREAFLFIEELDE